MKDFSIGFFGWITVRAENEDEAQDIFWDWVFDLDKLIDKDERYLEIHTECDGIEEG